MSLAEIRDASRRRSTACPSSASLRLPALSNDWAKFLDAFKDTEGRIRGCMFHLQSSGCRRDTISENEGMHVFRFLFVMGLRDADATGKDFEDLVMAAVDAFKADLTLSGPAYDAHGWGPLAASWACRSTDRPA
jgi:hypothetical protein